MNIQLVDLFHKGFWTALDWIYPPVCAGCGEPGYRLCLTCQEKIKIQPGGGCLVCAETTSVINSLCRECQTARPPYIAMRTFASYEGPIRACLHSLKYRNNQALGELFSRWLAEIVAEEGWQIDLVLPVPLSRERTYERGYNQSALIARPLAAALRTAYNPFGIRRVRDTRSQVGLSAEERHRNVADAFVCVSEIVEGKNVLLVDDVMTTGSTLKACSVALMKTGAKAVFCLTVARLSLENQMQNDDPLPV